MSATPSEPRCHTCRFWVARVKAPTNHAEHGDCHRHAPVAVAAIHLTGRVPPYSVELEPDRRRTPATWPITVRNDWCGEHGARP